MGEKTMCLVFVFRGLRKLWRTTPACAYCKTKIKANVFSDTNLLDPSVYVLGIVSLCQDF